MEALNVILNWKEIYRLPFITAKSSKSFLSFHKRFNDVWN
jgi:hypothetical protein